MIRGEGVAVVDRAADDVLELVMDLRRYRLADRKIGHVRAIDRVGDQATVRFRARMMGLPGPVVTQVMTMVPGERITVVNAPSWIDRLMRFDGVVECRPLPDGRTEVRHVEAFEFRRPWGRLLEPLLGAWLRRDTPAEVRRLAALLASVPPGMEA